MNWFGWESAEVTALKERVKELESRVDALTKTADSDAAMTYTYSWPNPPQIMAGYRALFPGSVYTPINKRVPVSEVLVAIINALDLRLSWDYGSPPAGLVVRPPTPSTKDAGMRNGRPDEP